ncbi:MAG: AAA family ATPase [Thermoproteus sp.]
MSVVLFYNAKGGVGKSTIAANVAYYLGTMYRVLLMDFSAADRTSTTMLAGQCRTSAGIYDILFRFDEAYGKRLAVETCPARLNSIEVLPPGSLEKTVLQLDYYVLAKRVDVLMNIVRHFVFTIVDYPGRSILTDPLLQALVRHVDHLVLVTQPTAASLNEAAEVRNFITQHYKPPPVVSIVTNMYMNERTYEETMKTAGGFAVRVPADPAVYALGRIPALAAERDGVSKEWKNSIKKIAEGIINAKMMRRHQVATFFP